MSTFLKWVLRIALTAFVIGVIVAALSGCGNDAPVASRDKTPALKFNMPDQFDTIASKCDGKGHRMFETQNHDGKPSGLAVVADASCNHVGP